MKFMEITGDDSSDRDKKMKESFDSLLEKDKDKKDKPGEKKPGLKLSLFEVAGEEQEKVEKDKSLFDFLKPEKDGEEESEPEGLEVLDDEETEHIVTEYVDARAEEVTEERKATPEADAEAIAATDANAALLENLREANEDGGIDSEEELDEILGATIDELDLTSPDTVDDEDEEATVPPIAGGGGAAPPPTPPHSPPAGGAAMPFPPLGGAPASPDMTSHPPERVVLVENRRKQAANLLVGGAVGYLIGRRRGRIKTERQLMPIQEKLEKEVKDLHSKIAEREERIRTIAAEKVRNTPETERKTVIEKLEKQAITKPEEAEKPTTPEPSRLEKLVKTIIPPIEHETEKIETKEVKRAEELALPELLAVAKRMEFQGTSVDQLYERGRIDSLGLKRAVSEFLAGRRFETALIESLHRYDSPEHLQSNTTASFGGGISGGGSGTYGTAPTATSPRPSATPINPSAYGASGFGVNPNTALKSQKIPAATVVIPVILGLLIAAVLIL